MTSAFISPQPLLLSAGSTRDARCGLRRPDTTKTRNRWYMLSKDRLTEFSLNSSPDPFDSTDSKAQEDIDWDKWSTTGEAMTIPAIPFPPGQVFMPGEQKQLHLFEARYLALFETVVVDYDKRCAHVLIDSNRKAMAAFGTTMAVKSWRRLEVGVSVDFEAVGRLKTARLKPSTPFLRGEFQIAEDEPMQGTDFDEARQLEKRFWSALDIIISACIKLDHDPIRKKIDTASMTMDATDGNSSSPQNIQSSSIAGKNKMFVLSPDAKKALFLQKVKQAAKRAVNHETIDFESEDISDAMLERRATGLSFAGWDFFPSQPGMRQKAIEGKNTVTRLETVVSNLEEHSRTLTAKLALQDALSEK